MSVLTEFSALLEEKIGGEEIAVILVSYIMNNKETIQGIEIVFTVNTLMSFRDPKDIVKQIDAVTHDFLAEATGGRIVVTGVVVMQSHQPVRLHPTAHGLEENLYWEPVKEKGMHIPSVHNSFKLLYYMA